MFFSGCYDGCVYFLDAKSGAEYFVHQTGDQVKSSPVVDHMTGSVYIGSHDHHVHALNVEKVILRHLLQNPYLRLLHEYKADWGISSSN